MFCDHGKCISVGDESHGATIERCEICAETNSFNLFATVFEELAAEAGRTAASKGWVKGNDGEAMMLMVAEIAEALEYNRNGNPASDHIPEFCGEEEEFADVIIRIMNYASLRNLHIGAAVVAKMKFNKTRPYKHGGKKY
jgi:NTP pyrophosphatase (non-canonical NTP hydrolase)